MGHLELLGVPALQAGFRPECFDGPFSPAEASLEVGDRLDVLRGAEGGTGTCSLIWLRLDTDASPGRQAPIRGVAPAASGLTLLTAAPGLTLPPGGMHLPGVWAPAATGLTLLTAATGLMLLTCSGRSSPPHPDGMHLSGGGDV